MRDLHDCCNFDCPNQVMAKKPVRCGRCRTLQIYTCCSCGVELSNPAKRRCPDCSHFSRLILYHRKDTYREYCVMCGKWLKRKNKVCSETCQKKLSKRRRVYRHRLSKHIPGMIFNDKKI